MSGALTAPAAIDGRRVRGARSRRAIAQAMLDLVRETQSLPIMDAVADRADVSRRSVFRHFADIEALIAAATDLQRAELNARFKPLDFSGLSEAERVRAVSGRVARIYEYITPFRRVADLLRQEHPIIDTLLRQDDADLMGRMGEAFRDTIAAAPLADQALLLRSMVSACAWPTWNGLRRDQFLTTAEARRVVERTLSALLTAARAGPAA